MDNFDKCAEYTKSQNWEGICEINNVSSAGMSSKKKELKVLPDYLEDDEVVFALTSGTTSTLPGGFGVLGVMTHWLVALTSDRFLLLSSAMMTKSVQTQSIGYDLVRTVSSSHAWLTGQLVVDLGSRTLVIDHCGKKTVSVIANLANKWLKEIQTKNSDQIQGSGAKEQTPLDKLEKLANLHATGALTDDEFNTAKKKILDTLS